jgi:outer membrane lipoprotein-sorting protein
MDVLMTLKVIVAVLLIVVPVCAQAQKPRVTKDDAQKVVTIISGDKAKTQTYSYEKNDSKIANELAEKN